MNTNSCFEPGKLTILIDGSAGSSGKGRTGSFVSENADNWQFCCNTFSAQAGHWVKLDNGKQYFYQTLNSCAYQDKYEKMYISPGSCIELDAFFREIEENNVKPERIGIHPLASLIQPIDSAYERGEKTFEGWIRKQVGDGTMKKGSTAHGVGACLARKILRRPEVVLARDEPRLTEFLCNTSDEIIGRLKAGQAGFFEIAQGFQLSLLHHDMYPYTTSRNVTVAAGLNDLMVPPVYAGQVIINFRTYPIRINNKKYRDPETKKHLYWEDVVRYNAEGKKIDIYEGNSGPGYSDQIELDWSEITKRSGSPNDIIEMTSVTKLPRRVFTFSRKNLREAIEYNNTGSVPIISINFIDYVDYNLKSKRGVWNGEDKLYGAKTDKLKSWLKANIYSELEHMVSGRLAFLGTGPLTEDTIICS